MKKAILLGDAMIPGEGFEKAWKKHLNKYAESVIVNDWESDWGQLQYRRLEVEKHGPEIEEVDETIKNEGSDAEFLMGLFVPISKNVMEAMPNLRIVGVSRAGLENVNVEEATKRGILVFNVKGRNAHAVSDFTIGMMLSENRNIARAHHSIKNGDWRKTFINTDSIIEMHDKTIGLVGFGHIGALVAKKLSGFDVRVIVYDPYTEAEDIEKHGCEKVELDYLMQNSDIVSLHARLSDENHHMIGENQLKMMKPTAYFINTARAGLVDQDALGKILKEGKIMGAALDVFETEPIPENSIFLELDNVTLTTHIAGTTAEALTNSPYMLMEDVQAFLEDGDPRFIVNPEVLDNSEFKNWLEDLKN
ncbi:2-hydroxyacid dehydrogenase [Hutsoniella sourekii]